VKKGLGETNIIPQDKGHPRDINSPLTPALRELMFSKIPQLKRENASLRNTGTQDPPNPLLKAGLLEEEDVPPTRSTEQGPQTNEHENDRKVDPKPDCKEEKGHYAPVETKWWN